VVSRSFRDELRVELGRIIQAALVPGFAGTLSNVWELRYRSALSWSMAGKRGAKTATARVVVAGAYSRDYILRPKRAGFGSTAQRQEKRGGCFATREYPLPEFGSGLLRKWLRNF